MSREYIHAFTSNYSGRGNPVRRHAASSREDQRTRRHSVLLHSLSLSGGLSRTRTMPHRRRDVGKKGENLDALLRLGEILGTFQQTHTHTYTCATRTKSSHLFRSFLSHRDIVFRYANFAILLTEESHTESRSKLLGNFCAANLLGSEYNWNKDARSSRICISVDVCFDIFKADDTPAYVILHRRRQWRIIAQPQWKMRSIFNNKFSYFETQFVINGHYACRKFRQCMCRQLSDLQSGKSDLLEISLISFTWDDRFIIRLWLGIRSTALSSINVAFRRANINHFAKTARGRALRNNEQASVAC